MSRSAGVPGAERANINSHSFHGPGVERTPRRLQLKLHAARLIRVCHEIHLKFTWIVAAIALVLGTGVCPAQESVDKAKAAAFDGRMFGGPLSQKTYACFVRRYDASHLAQHPKRKVSAMKLLVTAKEASEDKTVNYSFGLGFKYRHRAGNFDSSGFCSHTAAENSGGEIRLGCGVDCEGGGIEVAMKDEDPR